MKGKIPIIIKCGQCPHKASYLCKEPHCRCQLTGRNIEDYYSGGTIPEWCPLPDADRLLALLEMKGETNVADSLEVPASDN